MFLSTLSMGKDGSENSIWHSFFDAGIFGPENMSKPKNNEEHIIRGIQHYLLSCFSRKRLPKSNVNL